MKKTLSALLCAALLITALPLSARAAEGPGELKAGSALLMEKETGQILFEDNAHEKLEPASVTKVMTLLLVLDAVSQGRIGLDDAVTASPTPPAWGAARSGSRRTSPSPSGRC